MAKAGQFMIGDLVKYSPSAEPGHVAYGIVVECSTTQQKMSFVYTVRWLSPYEVSNKMVYEDQVYENSLSLLSRVSSA